MPIEKLIEFATTGAKNNDGLNLQEGFPSTVKPARQWVNWLFNSLCVKINELIDHQESTDPFPQYARLDDENPFPQYVRDDALRPRSLFRMEHINGLPYGTSHGTASGSVGHDVLGAAFNLGDCLTDPALAFAAPVSEYTVEGIALGGTGSKTGFLLRFDGYIQCGNYAGQEDTGFGAPAAELVFFDEDNNELAQKASLPLTGIDGSFANNGSVGHVTFRVGNGDFALYDIRKSNGSIPDTLKARLRMTCTSDSDGGSSDLQIFTVESFSITASY